jgi:hypothetical protein
MLVLSANAMETLMSQGPTNMLAIGPTNMVAIVCEWNHIRIIRRETWKQYSSTVRPRHQNT